jgi:hypothetical protein
MSLLGSLFYGDLHILQGNEPLYHGLGDLNVYNNSYLKNVLINGNISSTSSNIFLGNSSHSFIINSSGSYLNNSDIFIGNSNSNTINIGNSNNITNILGDLYVKGIVTSINSTNVNINDNIILLNNAPNLFSDSGLAIKRYQTANNISQGDIIQDIFDESGIIVSATSSTFVLPNTSNPSNEYYLDWWVFIYSGTGIGQVRKIKSYNGSSNIATIYNTIDQITNNWSPLQGLDFDIIPDNTSLFKLYPCNYVMNIWDESNNEFALICSSLNPTTSGNISINHYSDLRINNLNTSFINNSTADTILYISLNNTTNTPVSINLSKNWGVYRIMIEPVQSFSDQAIGTFELGRRNTNLSKGLINEVMNVQGLYNDQLGIVWNPNTLPLLFYKKMPIGLLGVTIFKLKISSI